MTRNPNVISFTEFRTRLRHHLDDTKVTGRPLFITTNGETEAVVLSPSPFDELMNLADLAKRLSILDRGMKDITAGRMRPAKAALRAIAGELNRKLDR